MIPTKTDLNISGQELQLYQFTDKVNITTLLSEYLKDLNQIDQDTFDIVGNFSLDLATSIYLDYIGGSLDILRLANESDNSYRKRIKSQILVNNSKGTPNDLLKILSNRTETDNVRLWEHYPVSYVMYTDGSNYSTELANILRTAGPITSETVVLIVDTTKAGFIGAEKVGTLANLVDENNDQIVDVNEDTIQAVTFSFKGKDRRGILSEFLQLAYEIVDDVGNQIVDSNGNILISFPAGNTNQTGDGVLMELIKSEN